MPLRCLSHLYEVAKQMFNHILYIKLPLRLFNFKTQYYLKGGD